jgi:hypothetical protein
LVRRIILAIAGGGNCGLQDWGRAALRRAAAVSGVKSRWGMPNISKPTMNFRTEGGLTKGG